MKADTIAPTGLSGRGLMEACPAPLLAIDLEGRIADANPAFVQLTGIAREKLAGSAFDGCFTDPEAARASYREVLSRGSVEEYPLSLRDASGTMRSLICSAAHYRNQQGQTAGVLLIAQDVTERRQREEELARLHVDALAQMEDLKQRESEIRRINDLYEILQTCNAQRETYPIIAAAAAQLFPQSGGALASATGRDQRMEMVAKWGIEPRLSATFHLDDCWALRLGRPHAVEPGDLQTCRHFQASLPSAPAPYMCVPLIVGGELQGMLHLHGVPGTHISTQQRHLLVTLGEVVKLSLSGLKLREALRSQAIRDPLTGLFNRNYLDETLRRELSRSGRRRAPLCLAMLDIDGFKTFNDSYSHYAGDIVLKALGAFFMKNLRASDIACRYGGDEFVLVLPDTDPAQVCERLDRLRTQVKQLRCEYEGHTLPATSISIGVAQYVAQSPEHGSSAVKLLKAADTALYAAKHRGKDQLAVCGEAAK